MDTTYLVGITVIMLIISAISSGAIIKMKFAKNDNDRSIDLNTLSAESLLELVAGTALSTLFADGDNVEIIIKTNGQPIAGKEYLASSMSGHTKLVTNA